MKDVFTTNAPAAIGPYTQAKVVGNMVYTSGQIAIVPATGNLAEGGICLLYTSPSPRDTR